MEDQAKQFQALEEGFEFLAVEVEDRPAIRLGFQRFFDAGWPSNYVDMGMMRAAGKGLMPFPFKWFGDMKRYKDEMVAAGYYVPGTATDPSSGRS